MSGFSLDQLIYIFLGKAALQGLKLILKIQYRLQWWVTSFQFPLASEAWGCVPLIPFSVEWVVLRVMCTTPQPQHWKWTTLKVMPNEIIDLILAFPVFNLCFHACSCSAVLACSAWCTQLSTSTIDKLSATLWNYLPVVSTSWGQCFK